METAVKRKCSLLPSVSHPDVSRKLSKPVFSIQGRAKNSPTAILEFRQSLPELPAISKERRANEYCTPSMLESPVKMKRKANELYMHNVNEIEAMLRDKVLLSENGIKLMFKANDCNGKGIVTRHALLRIIFTLIGFINSEQFKIILKRNGLLHLSKISYEDFISCFREKKPHAKQWIKCLVDDSPSISTNSPHPEKELRNSDSKDSRSISVPFCVDLMRKSYDKSPLKLLQHLPAENCLILFEHLKVLLRELNLKVSEIDMINMWKRFDRESVGAISHARFRDIMTSSSMTNGNTLVATATSQEEADLRRVTNTCPIAYDTRSPVQELRNTNDFLFEENVMNTETILSSNDVTSDLSLNLSTTSANKSSESDVEPSAKNKEKKTKHNHFNSIVDRLKYKFEKTYQEIVASLKYFDKTSSNGDALSGMVTRMDLKKVLDEFGIVLSVMDLQLFLTKSGIKQSQGRFCYQDFCDVFWKRTEPSLLTHRLKANPDLMLSKFEKSDENQTVSQVEEKLLLLIHQDYFNMTNEFKKYESGANGSIEKVNFKKVITKLMDEVIDEEQFEKMVEKYKLADEKIDFAKFLQSFTERPGNWNQQVLHTFRIRQMSPLSTIPSVVKRLKRQNTFHTMDIVRSASTVSPMISCLQWLKNTETPKPVDRHSVQLIENVKDLFVNKFYLIDKELKSIDRKMVGRFNKQQLFQAFNRSGFQCSQTEFEVLWSTLHHRSKDDIISYAELVEQFLPAKKQATKDLKECSDIAENNFTEKSTNTVSKHQYEIVKLLKSQIIEKWSDLKDVFKHLDKRANAQISRQNMKEVFQLMQINISAEEKEKLLIMFDLNKDGNFHYAEFMKSFTQNSKK